MTVKELPLETKLIQLAEESAELAQASLKMIRVLAGDTPVTPEEAMAHLLEKIADVNVCLVALDLDQYTVEAIMRQKACRWERRLNRKDREDES